MKLDTNSKRDYDIACALRGSDLPRTGALKWALTCRIRHLVGCSWEAATRRKPLSLNEAEAALKQVEGRQDELSHYMCHVGVAARALGDDGLERLTYGLNTRGLPTPEVVVKLAGGD